ncbi:TIGR01212 family radical SAM protein [Tissierella creatinini]|nr:TIGR01212 family radical SAM protein [Tissierella creatinini]TJX67304.1 TIGR01212 family radical SAM protein [Soehngenia saccharolytica]
MFNSWNGKRYHTLNYELQRIFGQKIMKISLDGGFSCPNRDGTLGLRGCIFCGEEGSGEFAGSRIDSLKDQVNDQIKLISKKNQSNMYIAYFQSFTNTYKAVEELKNLYYEALSFEGVVGIAIATRPDCLNGEVLDLLSELNEKTFLWIELGLQTIHESTAKFIRRGYSLSVYDKAIENLRNRNIRCVTHLIIGLPGENKDMMLKSVKHVGDGQGWGIKLHSLYIQKDTDLYHYFINNPFSLLTKDEYIDIIVDAIEILPSDMVIHRLTGDGKRDLLYEPKWTLNKLGVLSAIDKELKNRNSHQGINHKA